MQLRNIKHLVYAQLPFFCSWGGGFYWRDLRPDINSRDAVNIASAKFINRYVQVTQWQVKPPGKGG
jgi:hypothetical protein